MSSFESVYSTKMPNNLTYWCIRLEINKTNLILKSMQLQTIIEKIYESGQGQYYYVMHSPENITQIVVRVYFLNHLFKKTDVYKDIEKIEQSLLEITLRGVPKIIGTQVIDISRTAVDKDGKLITQKEYAIKTYGTNIYGVMLNPWIDPYTIVQ